MRCVRDPSETIERRVLIGTSGYSYKDWIGPFYPPGKASKDMLAFYARQFHFTEINSTYYRLPTARMIEQMSHKVPEGFIFSLKAYQGITHERGESVADYCLKLRTALQPLVDRGRLGAILIQFPYSFRNNAANRDYLVRVREYLRDLPLAAEFRNADWSEEAAWQRLHELEIAYVCVDGPRLRGLPAPVVKVTSSLSYVRFHGRNTAKWWTHEQSYERYDYLYSERELEDWVPRIHSLSAETERVFVAFNNHFNAQSVRNACMLKEMLVRHSSV